MMTLTLEEVNDKLDHLDDFDPPLEEWEIFLLYSVREELLGHPLNRHNLASLMRIKPERADELYLILEEKGFIEVV